VSKDERYHEHRDVIYILIVVFVIFAPLICALVMIHVAPLVMYNVPRVRFAPFMVEL